MSEKQSPNNGDDTRLGLSVDKDADKEGDKGSSEKDESKLLAKATRELEKEISLGRAWENWTSIAIFSLFAVATAVIVVFVVSIFVCLILLLYNGGIVAVQSLGQGQILPFDMSLVYLSIYITVPTVWLVIGNFRRRGRVKSVDFDDGVLQRLGEGLSRIFKRE